jgi:hypothetical protein
MRILGLQGIGPCLSKYVLHVFQRSGPCISMTIVLRAKAWMPLLWSGREVGAGVCSDAVHLEREESEVIEVETGKGVRDETRVHLVRLAAPALARLQLQMLCNGFHQMGPT